MKWKPGCFILIFISVTKARVITRKPLPNMKKDMPANKSSKGTKWNSGALVQVDYTSVGRSILLEQPGQTFLQAAIKNRISHMMECGGNGRCTTCRLRILDGMENVTPRNALEDKLARERSWEDNIRLACQSSATGPVKVERLIKTFSEVSRLQVEKVKAERGEEKKLAILFCDMRNFTTFVEGNLAYDVVHILNRLFVVLGEPILMNNGFIYQYVGDEIVALFGMENDNAEESCLSAIRAALGMSAALESFNVGLQEEFGVQIEIGIGVHYGAVVAGRLGHPSHQQFSVIGDAANVASRVQAATRTMRAGILASEAVLDELPAEIAKTGISDTVELKGKSRPVQLFELLGFSKPDKLFLVQESMAILFQDDGGFANDFYERLFKIAPEVQHLFKGSIKIQGYLMTHMLKGAIYSFGRPKNLALGFQELGKRHLDYGVEDYHYPIVREALVATLRDRLGDNYKPELKEAWEWVIEQAFALMLQGAEKARKKKSKKKPMKIK